MNSYEPLKDHLLSESLSKDVVGEKLPCYGLLECQGKS